jgi:hypothetical protein
LFVQVHSLSFGVWMTWQLLRPSCFLPCLIYSYIFNSCPVSYSWNHLW